MFAAVCTATVRGALTPHRGVPLGGLSTLAELAIAACEPNFTPSAHNVKIRRLALRAKPLLRRCYASEECRVIAWCVKP